MEILVMGPGCPKCNETAELVKKTAAEAGVEVQVQKVTDFQEMAKRGVFSTPAVVIGGQIKCVGRVPTKQEVQSWLK
ncbi:MAG: thioredoxin family protein [Desulfobacteraceae bacterium]|nr:thioredoxin family protein [Desulfobacteraceae bacterium]